MKIPIAFCNLTHRDHTAKGIPYGISMIASYALKNFNDKIEVEIFKSPEEFIQYLEKKVPEIACFTNCIWNTNLSYQFAKRIKKKYPRTITVFGGPNYPIDPQEQKEFLQTYEDIDFYIIREGEEAFVELLKVLLENNLDFKKVKSKQLRVHNCHYVYKGRLIMGELLPPISNLDDIPSPYLSGLCDKFLGENLIPVTQTTRGCPFRCTYCQEGHEYFSNVRRFSFNRIKDELRYIVKHSRAQTLQLADTNFGMYNEDLEICNEIALLQKEYGWPKYFTGIVGKNRKDRILKAISLVRGSSFSAAIQSSDEQVLKNIKRDNVSKEEMIELTQAAKKFGSGSFSELILCLPGDTKEAHFESNFELIDAGIDMVRSHQFIMLPGSEASTKESRKKYRMITGFRVTPKTVTPYRLFEEEFFAPEIDEICVANKTMPFEDYLECRLFNLTVEIFYNNGIFEELIKFLKMHNIKTSSLIMSIHKRIRSSKPISKIYDDFLRETNEIWKSREELVAFLNRPGVIEKFISEEMGNNEQLVYRTLVILNNMDELHKTAFSTAEDMLLKKGGLEENALDYLRELRDFSLMRKKEIFSVDEVEKKLFHYDFIALLKSNFKENPLALHIPAEIELEFSHTNDQKEFASNHLKIYGTSKDSLSYILSSALRDNRMYRKVRKLTF